MCCDAGPSRTVRRTQCGLIILPFGPGPVERRRCAVLHRLCAHMVDYILHGFPKLFDRWDVTKEFSLDQMR
jgi:hypothetical protein